MYPLYFIILNLFIWLCWVLTMACGIFSCGRRALSGGVWDLVPWLGIEPVSPALGAWRLSHWTTREVSQLLFIIDLVSCNLFEFISSNRFLVDSLGYSVHNTVPSVNSDSFTFSFPFPFLCMCVNVFFIQV